MTLACHAPCDVVEWCRYCKCTVPAEDVHSPQGHSPQMSTAGPAQADTALETALAWPHERASQTPDSKLYVHSNSFAPITCGSNCAATGRTPPLLTAAVGHCIRVLDLSTACNALELMSCFEKRPRYSVRDACRKTKYLTQLAISLSNGRGGQGSCGVAGSWNGCLCASVVLMLFGADVVLVLFGVLKWGCAEWLGGPRTALCFRAVLM